MIFFFFLRDLFNNISLIDLNVIINKQFKQLQIELQLSNNFMKIVFKC